jgi:hypothetical protein
LLFTDVNVTVALDTPVVVGPEIVDKEPPLDKAVVWNRVNVNVGLVPVANHARVALELVTANVKL